jgi:hypothetical protein
MSIAGGGGGGGGGGAVLGGGMGGTAAANGNGLLTSFGVVAGVFTVDSDETGTCVCNSPSAQFTAPQRTRAHL